MDWKLGKITVVLLAGSTAAHAQEDDAAFQTNPAQKWSAELKVDPMTDKKTCQVTPESGTPFPKMPYPMFIYRSKGVVVTAVIVGGDFPGKDVSFRVDKLPAISEQEMLGTANTQKLVQQIRSGGKVLLTRSYNWPEEFPNTKEFALDGLVSAFDKCKALLK